MACLLVRSLRACGHARPLVLGPRTACAISHREDIGVTGRDQRLLDHELIQPVRFQPIEVLDCYATVVVTSDLDDELFCH